MGNTLHCHLKVHAWLFILHWYPLSLAVLCKCSFGYRTGKHTGIQVNFKSSLPVSPVNIITLDTFVNKINGVSDNCGSYDIWGLWGTMLKSLILCDIKYPEAFGVKIFSPPTSRCDFCPLNAPQSPRWGQKSQSQIVQWIPRSVRVGGQNPKAAHKSVRSGGKIPKIFIIDKRCSTYGCKFSC